jgi:ATP adenylyltransferase
VTERLWAPWRLEYIQSVDDGSGCFLCAAAEPDADDDRHLIVHRGDHALVLLNRFPYAPGHLLVAPFRHDTRFDTLDDAEAREIHRLGTQSLAALRESMRPEGYNLGWNVGRVAGAGVEDHAHLHVVPRWNGDTNFMPALADVKVMPEYLAETRRKLAAAWPSQSLE